MILFNVDLARFYMAFLKQCVAEFHWCVRFVGTVEVCKFKRVVFGVVR
jgi:hypothetical protein